MSWSCQTYEGGIGGEPGNEAHGRNRSLCYFVVFLLDKFGWLVSLFCLCLLCHLLFVTYFIIIYYYFAFCEGGYAFCGLAGLMILGETHKINLPNLLRWAALRQMPLEGGFQGRCFTCIRNLIQFNSFNMGIRKTQLKYLRYIIWPNKNKTS